MQKLFSTFINVILIALPPLILLIIFLYANSHILSIHPSQEYYSRGYWSYSDKSARIDFFNVGSDLIAMNYTIQGADSYAGIGFNLAAEFPLLDLTGYAALRLDIATQKKTRLGIRIKTFEPGITERKDEGFVPLRDNEILSDLDQKHNRVIIPLHTLKDPHWWLSEYAGGQGLEKSPFRYAHTLQIFFNAVNPVGQSNQVELKEVVFLIVPAPFWPILFFLTCAYYALYAMAGFFVRIIRKKHDKKVKLLLSYKKIAKESYREKDTDRMSRYINNNYHDPAISLESIVAATGLSRKRITALCQQEYNMTLKECINWLRLAEAKRLLLESDLAITEIAFTLGYSSSSYFGMLFKNQEGMSPKEFRKKERHNRGNT